MAKYAKTAPVAAAPVKKIAPVAAPVVAAPVVAAPMAGKTYSTPIVMDGMVVGWNHFVK